MSSEIEFGDVEVPRPERGVRPDANPRYAVAVCGAPGAKDLSVYVELDAMIDMEEHALSDDTVELGGVLLGRAFEDDEGKPFVVVTDCLRAKHYESTRGSFKFTHDTWSEITRQKDEYPGDIAMVGWYHTHPDWGVFLSGMDLFICNHFFNKPLDLALVIDPCRDDRGWFQWPENGGEPRRTGGFHVFGSRFRQAEIEAAAQAWQEGNGMFSETRRRPAASTNAPPGTTIVQVPDSGQNAWMSTAIVAALAMQTVLVVAALWRLGGDSEEKVVRETVAEMLERIEAREETRREAQRLEDKRKMLDDVLARLKDAPPDFTKRLIAAQEEVEAREIDAVAHRAATIKIAADLDRASGELASTKKLVEEKVEQIKNMRERHDKTIDEKEQALRAANEQIKKLGGDLDDDASKQGFALKRLQPYLFPTLFSLLVGAGFGAVGMMMLRKNGDEEPAPTGERDPPRDESPKSDPS